MTGYIDVEMTYLVTLKVPVRYSIEKDEFDVWNDDGQEVDEELIVDYLESGPDVREVFESLPHVSSRDYEVDDYYLDEVKVLGGGPRA